MNIDNKPGDGDDVLPVDPTTTFSGVDYTVDNGTSKNIKLQSPTQYLKPKVSTPSPNPRISFSAIIVELGPKETPRRYTVLTQNLRRIDAYSFGTEGLYQDYRIGDQIQIEEGQIANTWRISGGQNKAMLPTAVIGMSTDSVIGNQIIALPFDNILRSTGDVFSVDDNGILVSDEPDVIQVQATLQVTIECQAQSRSQTSIYFQATEDRIGETSIAAKFISMVTGQAPPIGVQRDGTLVVYDYQFLWPNILNLGFGIAVYDEISGEYRITEAQQRCVTAWAVIDETGGMDSEGDVTIREFHAMSPSPFNLVPDPLPTIVRNDRKHMGKYGDIVELEWDDSIQKYEINDVTKKKTEVFFDARIKNDGTFVDFLETFSAIEYSVEPIWASKLQITQCGTY